MKSKNYTQLKILNKHENKKIEKKLNEQFGIKKIPGIILRRGQEKLFLFSGNFSAEKIKKLEKEVPIERVGIYFAKQFEDKIKLSMEGVYSLKKQITKNIFQIKENQVKNWMNGQDLQIKTGKKGFLIIKFKDDFLGSGKASTEKIGNYIPKARRLKNKKN